MAEAKTKSRSKAAPARRDGLNPGDTVTNPLKPDWGPGRVIALERNLVFVYFRDREVAEVIRMKEEGLAVAEPDPTLDALPAFVARDRGYAVPAAARRKKAAAKKAATPKAAKAATSKAATGKTASKTAASKTAASKSAASKSAASKTAAKK